MKPRPFLPQGRPASAGPRHRPDGTCGIKPADLYRPRVGLPLPLIVALVLAAPSTALADLMLYPTRIIISGAQRSAQVEIVNRGERTETYRISLVNRRMNEAGDIVPAETPEAGEQFAETMLVFSPRQVTLQPGQSQTVRVSVRRPAGLADGEYRSHLQFERQPDINPQNNLENVNETARDQVSVNLEALIGASIPVIIRQGQIRAEVSLQNLALSPGAGDQPPVLGFSFRRTGAQSVYGDVVATFTPANGKPVEVGRFSGVAVYVPNPVRQAQIPLRPPAGVALRNGALRLTYSEQASAGGKLLADAQLLLP